MLSLRCYCENSRLCTGDVDICSIEDGDACIVSVTPTGYEYSCIEKTPHDDFVLECLDGVYDDHGVSLCCSTDMCNRDLRPTLPPSMSALPTTQDLDTAKTSARSDNGTSTNTV